MPKKKKTQLKPVARVFATTSIPKKAATVDPVDVADDDANDAPPTPDLQTAPAINTEPTASQPSPEEQFIIDWISKNQDRVEREIQRALKALEVDRRFAKTHLPLELDSDFQDQILKLVAEESTGPENSVEDDEDKALLRLGITYGVLMRVGLPQDIVEECIRGMSGVDLEDATTWFTLNRPNVNLGEVIDAPYTRGQLFACSYSAVPPSPKTAPVEVQPAPPAESQPAPDSEPLSSEPVEVAEPAEQQASTKSGFWGGGESESESDSEEDDLDLDPNLHYAQLKVRIYTAEISQRRGIRKDAAADTALQTLRDRLAKVKQNYLFREKDAEALYRSEKVKADAAAKTARLRAPPAASAAASRKQGKASRATSETPAAASSEPATVSDSGDGSLLGGVFEAMDGDSPSNTSVAIAVRDMALPKLWTGRTPQLQLRDTISQVDKFALVGFARVGGPSRIARASCTIRWSDSRADYWEMKEVGCIDEAQANNFISVVALHALSSEVAAGFATSGTSASAKIFSFIRLLPAAYRDLWDDLEQQRTKQEEIQNQSAWSTLRNALSGKLVVSSRVAAVKASRNDDKQTSSRPKQRNQQGPSSEQIKEDWAARRARLEYRFMEEQRSQLPISQYRQDILRLLEFSQVCVLSGETGCGKSSQLPQFILQDQLEQGRHCNIICTEPRRISAISLAQRVSQELGEPSGAVGSAASLVGYSIRLESNTSRTTRLTYMTNGIALRMLENGGGGGGTSFDEVTHIIIDEVHERSIESDFLLIVLKSLLPRRPDLRIVLMSATLDAEKISAYFDNCPTIHVPGRTFPVRVSYLEDALELSGWVVAENSPYARDARVTQRAKDKERQDPGLPADDDDIEVDSSVPVGKVYSRATLDSLGRLNERLIPMELIIRLLETICWKNQDYVPFSAAVLVFMPGIAEIRQLIDLLGEHADFGDESRFVILPLHSTLSSQDQSDVFNVPPPSVRKIVVSTNIAETGVTIPDITCVIDSGKHREMRYDEKRQLSRLVDTFITKSNAAQRRGRAGRVREGLSFHLFSKHRHDTQMMENPQPEMLRLSLASLALRIKITNVALGSSIENVFLSALDPPSQLNIQRAINSLVEVGALTSSENITPLGQLLSKLPIDVHLGKLLAVAANLGCLDPALTVAATLSNGKSAFVTPFGQEQEADRAKQTFNLENNDFLTMHNVYASWRRACGNTGFARKFVRQHFLSHQALQQIEELRQQLLRYLIDASLVEADRDLIRDLNRSRGGRARTHFISVPVAADRNAEDLGVVQAAIAAGLWPKVVCLAKEGTYVQMKTLGNSQVVAFHPTSVNFQRPPRDFAVNFLAYFTLMQSRRLYAWETGAVHDLPVAILCGDGDYKAATETLTLDKSKVRYRLTPRSGIALQHLRQRVASGFASRMRGRQLKDSEKRWMDLAVQVLRRKRVDDSLQIGISR